MEAVADEWRAHPVHAQYSANQALGQVRNEKGRVLKPRKDGWFSVSDSQRKRSAIKYMTFIEQCFGAVSEAEAKRKQLEDTGDWKTHPTFSDYLGSRDGEVFSLKSLRVINGQKKGKYGFIAMHLALDNEGVYVTQHKFIYECFNGLMCAESELTHCNGVEADNNLSNLKLITEEEETRVFDSTKKHPHPTFSKYTGDVNGNIYVQATDEKLNFAPNKAGYIEVKLVSENQSVSYQAHRFIYEVFHGLLDKDLQVDHRNTAKADNKITNLTALTQRAHTQKTRRDNPQMSEKRAATCSKALCRLKIDEMGNVIEKIRYASAKLAVAASNIECNAHGIQDAIKEHRLYKGYMWEYELPPDLPGELWETFVDHDGFKVVVSSAGRVRTSYGVSYGHDNGYGYMCIGFGEDRKYLIHILVCTAFHGLPPSEMEDPTVDHDDRDRANNNSTNLRWASRETQGENRATTRKVVGFLLSDATVTFGPYESIAQAGTALTANTSSISACCKGKRKSAGKHGGSPLGWKYVDV